MASSPNLKVSVTADTSQFSKNIKTAQTDVKNFGGVAGAVTDKVAGLFGVNTGQIQKVLSGLRGMGKELETAGNAGVQSMGKLATAIGGAGAAFAGLGIAAVVAQFKALDVAAQAFQRTVQGTNMQLQTQAYIETYRQAFMDNQGDLGKAMAETKNNWKKWWAEVKTVAAATMNYATVGFGYRSFVMATQDAQGVAEKAERAAQLQGEIYDLQRKLSDELVRTSELEADIAEYRRIAADHTESISTRENAIAKAAELIRTKYGIILPIETAIADKMSEMNSLAESSAEEIDAANQQRIKANNLSRQQATDLRSLSRLQTSIASDAAKEAAERQKAADALREANALAADKASRFGDMGTLSGMAAALYDSARSQLTATMPAISIPVKPEVDKAQCVIAAEQIKSLVTDAIESSSTVLGELIGDLATGGDAWGNFKNAALSAMADMAISVGKIAISTGIAESGIKEALSLGNPYVAIAAGAALVALGSAVKAGLSNAAGGSGYSSGSAGVASSSGAAATSGDFSQLSNIKVEVTGKLQAQGSQLVAVLNNENYRLEHTT